MKPLPIFRQSPRIDGVDVARGLAILGMILFWFAPRSQELTRDPGTWTSMLDGRVLTLFAIVAGVSVGLLTGGKTIHQGVLLTQDRIRLMVRAVGIFAIGHLMAMLGVPFADTLTGFAVLIALTLPFLTWSWRRLMAFSVSWILLLPFLTVAWTWVIGQRWFSEFGHAILYISLGNLPILRYLPMILIGLGISRLDLSRELTRRWLSGIGAGLLVISILVAQPGVGTLNSALNGADDRPVSLAGSSSPFGRAMAKAGQNKDGGLVGDDKMNKPVDTGILSTPDETENVDITGMSCISIYGFVKQCYPTEEAAKAQLAKMHAAKQGPAVEQQPAMTWSQAWQAEGEFGGYRDTVNELGIRIGFALIVLGVSLYIGNRGKALAALGAMPITAYVALSLMGKWVDVPASAVWIWGALLGSLVIAFAWQRFVGRGPVEAILHRISTRAARINGEQRSGIPSRDRVIGLDVARGLALIGMAAVHLIKQLPYLSWNPDTWLGIVSGRSSILFAVLAGVSMAIMTGRDHPYVGEKMMQARSRILTRALVIFAVGVVLASFSHPIAIILDYYGIFFLLAVPFVTWRVRNLFIGAGVLAIVAPFINYFLKSNFDSAQDNMLFGYLFGGIYPGLGWLALMLFGLGIGRLRLGDLRVQQRLLLAGLALTVVGWGTGEWAEHASGFQAHQRILQGVITEVQDKQATAGPLTILPGEEIDTQGWKCVEELPGEVVCFRDRGPKENAFIEPDMWFMLGNWSPHSGTTFEFVGSGGFALIVISACLILTRKAAWLWTPLSAIGTAALTAYVGHVLMLAFWTNPPTGIYDVFLIFFAVAIPAAMIWKYFFGRGPLERILSWMASRNAEIHPVEPASDQDPRIPAETVPVVGE